MGRTITPFTSVLNREFKNLGNFRKALRKEDRKIFDQLWEKARTHIQSCNLAAFPLPMEGILLSICIELMKEINKLKNEK